MDLVENKKSPFQIITERFEKSKAQHFKKIFTENEKLLRENKERKKGKRPEQK
jgi:hypothetical protein